MQVHNTVTQKQFFSIFPFLQTNITSGMWPSGGKGGGSIGRDRQQMIMLGNTQLVQCEDFVYLGRAISQDLTCEKDVTRRIGFASDIVRNLNKI